MRLTLAMALLPLWLAACSDAKTPPPATLTPNETAAVPATGAASIMSATTAPPTELVIQEVRPGKGAAIARGSTAVVHYTGWLYDPAAADHKGRKFDSSRDRNEPFDFSLGAGQVIAGWDEGVTGMTVGSQRQLIIPPAKGYGASGAGGVIPPNATLVFDVELVAIK
jgi:FKBP-type peptidyl-prolyl cis-trans isomerase FkpA